MKYVKSIFKTGVVFLMVALGILGGYAVGDMFVQSTAFITPGEMFEFRVGMPFMGAIAFLAIARFLITRAETESHPATEQGKES